MSEQEHASQVSALFDGELPREQAELVTRRVLKDPSLRAEWGRYALIGACVRGEPLTMAMNRSDLAARLRTRLAAEAAVSPVETADTGMATDPRRGTSLLRRGVLGGVIAASVALVSLALVNSMAPAPGLPAVAPVQMARQAEPAQVAAPQPAAAAPLQVARESAPPSYTTPVDDSPARRSAPLFNYVAAHSDVAVSAVRLAPLSSVMGGSFDLTQDAVEMTAAEVGARH